MKILLITGDHSRHLFFANTIVKNFPNTAIILQQRENFLPQPPENISEHDKENFIRHFKNRKEAEIKHFGDQPRPNIETYNVTKETLSSQGSADFVRKIAPDITLIFGSNMIREPLFGALPEYKINLHLGLSPWYKGDATLFWPFYNMEPNNAGSTFHIIADKPDAGAVIHQVVPPLSKEDKIHDVACKVVLESSKAAVDILNYLEKNKELPLIPQTATGKNFLGRDFKPEHLRVVYDLFNDDMVEQYLDGRLTSRKLKLITLNK